MTKCNSPASENLVHLTSMVLHGAGITGLGQWLSTVRHVSESPGISLKTECWAICKNVHFYTFSCDTDAAGPGTTV